MPSVQLNEAEFKRRFKAQYSDPAFDAVAEALDQVAAVAWDSYANSRKSPRTQKAGHGFADPDYDLAEDWIGAKAAIDRARAEHDDPSQPPCILIINEVRNAARTLLEAVQARRSGKLVSAGNELEPVRQK